MSVEEARERLAQGWTFAEAMMGKEWQAKYPNIAAWRGGYCVAGSENRWKISLTAHSGSEYPGFHATSYTLVEAEVACSTEPDRYRAVDDLIATWNAARGPEALLHFQRGWRSEIGWQQRYPHIAEWIARGKRHCIDIKINCVTGQAHAKAWLYDKPSNTETILCDERMQKATEPEILSALNAGIGKWLREHERA